MANDVTHTPSTTHYEFLDLSHNSFKTYSFAEEKLKGGYRGVLNLR